MKWELAYLDVLHRNAKLLNAKRNENHTLTILYEAGRSFGDVTFVTMFGHIDILSIGFILMFFYVLVIFSDYNWVGWRVSFHSRRNILNIPAAIIVEGAACWNEIPATLFFNGCKSL